MGLFSKIKKRNITIDLNNYISSVPYSTNIRNNSLALECIDIIASLFSALPIDLYKRVGENGKVKITNTALSNLLKVPNYEEGRALFYYNLVSDYFNHGNIFLYKYYNKQGELSSLFRINPTTVTVYRDTNNIKTYNFNNQEYNYNQVLHIPSRFGYDGLVGKSVFDVYRDTFNIAQAIENYFRASFNNGMMGDKRVILDVSKVIDKKLTKEQADEWKSKLINEYVGYVNTDKPIMKTIEGAEYTTLDVGSTSSKEKQLAESLEIIQNMICKIFNVPTSFVGEKDSKTLENSYQTLLDFALRPIVDNIMDGFTSLLTPYERDIFIIEPNYNALMRLNLTDKTNSYVANASNGFLTINEVRAKENLPSIGPAGDIPNIPANMIPLNEETVAARLATQKLALVELQKIDTNNAKTGEY